MNRNRLFFFTFGTANIGLILYGLLTLIAPNTLVDSFSSHVYRFPANATLAVEYLTALFRLLGFLNLILGITGVLLLWRYKIDNQPWQLYSIIVISSLAYLGPIVFDNMVGTIGFFEMIEHVIFAAMILSAIMKGLDP